MSTQIAELPDAPAATDPVDTFDAKAFAFNAALSAFRTQANAMALEMQINADVAASLILAMALPQFAGTSTSSVTVGTGTRTFETQAGKGWLPGQIVVASSGANYVKGTVTDYTGTDLELNVTSINGSGTYATWSIGLSYDGLALAGSGDNDNILRLLGLVEVPAVVAAAQLAAYVPEVPQTVLSGPVDTNGFAAFGGTTGMATLTTSGALKATCFAGNGLHRVGSITNAAFTSPGGTGTAYPYLEISAAGVVTVGVSSLPWIYQHGGTPSVTSGQHTVNTQEGKVYVGNGSTATQVYRVCIGLCPHTSGAWSGSPNWYALKNYFLSTDQTVTGNSVLNVAHGLGVVPSDFKVVLRCISNDSGYLANDEVPADFLYANGVYVLQTASDATNVTIVLSGSNIQLLNKSTRAATNITLSNWRWVVRAWA